jgi:copper chaperone CopZ
MKMVKYFSISILALLVIVSGMRTANAQNAASKTATLKMKVEVHCSDCKEKVTTGLKKVDGVKTVDVDVPTKMVTITYDPAKTDKDKLVKAVENIGYRTEFTPKDAKIKSGCGMDEGKKCPEKK